MRPIWKSLSGSLCFVTILVSVLAGCSAPSPQAQTYGFLEGTQSRSNNLSAAREQELGKAFIGRDFVFRVLWHEYADIDPDPNLNDPCPLKAVTHRAGGMLVRVPAGTAERGQLVVSARPGDVATIKGLVFAHDRLTLFARKPDGLPVYISVLMPRGRTIIFTKTTDCGTRQKIDNDNLNVAWLENVLVGSAIEFIAPAAPQVTQVALPEPAAGLVLQPSPAAPPREPTVRLLAGQAEPARVRHGESVHLTMQFLVEGDSGTQPVIVKESYGLSHLGKDLPRFPVTRSEARFPGEYQGVYTQQIPRAAAAGVYNFKAEVCLEGRCSSLVSEFAIVE